MAGITTKTKLRARSRTTGVARARGLSRHPLLEFGDHGRPQRRAGTDLCRTLWFARSGGCSAEAPPTTIDSHPTPPLIAPRCEATLPLQGRVKKPTSSRRSASSSFRKSATVSHRRDVLAVLDRQQDARAVVEAVAVLFGPVVDALGCGDLL